MHAGGMLAAIIPERRSTDTERGRCNRRGEAGLERRSTEAHAGAVPYRDAFDENRLRLLRDRDQPRAVE